MPHPASGCSVLPFANPAHSKNCWHPRLPNGLTLPAPPLRSRKHSERREGIEGAEVLAKKSLPFRLTFLSHNSPNADKPLLPVFLSQTVLTDTLAAGGAVHEPPVARVQCGMEPRAPAIGIEDKDVAGTHDNAPPHAVPGLGLRIGHAGDIDPMLTIGPPDQPGAVEPFGRGASETVMRTDLGARGLSDPGLCRRLQVRKGKE